MNKPKPVPVSDSDFVANLVNNLLHYIMDENAV
jgi:hypothetical protein